MSACIMGLVSLYCSFHLLILPITLCSVKYKKALRMLNFSGHAYLNRSRASFLLLVLGKEAENELLHKELHPNIARKPDCQERINNAPYSKLYKSCSRPNKSRVH